MKGKENMKKEIGDERKRGQRKERRVKKGKKGRKKERERERKRKGKKERRQGVS